MQSRREYLTAAAAGVLGIGIAPDEVDTGTIEELYEATFNNAEVAQLTTDGGHHTAHIETPHVGGRPAFDATEINVYDWWDDIGLGIDQRANGVHIGACSNLDLDDARRLRDYLTVAIAAHEEFADDYRPGYTGPVETTE